MFHWQPRFDFQHPPGSYEQWLDHPQEDKNKVAVGISHEHRFAFYFWGRWLHTMDLSPEDNRPDLITIDWHRDLASPTEQEKADLKQLSLDNSNELSLFSWGYLNPHNDDHVLSAAYKNFIGDIYVLCKQKFANPDSITDYRGIQHQIHVYDQRKSLIKSISPTNQIILDIDLDYFTETESFMGMDSDVELVSDEVVRNMMDPNSDFFQTIFDRLLGMTIALEPKFCGGYRNSTHLFNLLDETLFDPPLLHPDAHWKHLK